MIASNADDDGSIPMSMIDQRTGEITYVHATIKRPKTAEEIIAESRARQDSKRRRSPYLAWVQVNIEKGGLYARMLADKELQYVDRTVWMGYLLSARIGNEVGVKQINLSTSLRVSPASVCHATQRLLKGGYLDKVDGVVSIPQDMAYRGSWKEFK